MTDKIGKFEVIELLGRGAMGVVYKGHDPSLARHVAIKVMTAHLEMDPELRARFFREAQAAGSLQHPNIITIFELGESGGQPYIAMEYVPGRDLDDIIAAREALTIVEKVDLIEQVCRGLSFAHERRIVHRDIKPANIRVTEMGQVKVMDFGVAHLVSSDLTATGSLVGTPYYMAPEVINGEPVDARADIFSMGATFYELLSYTRPFQGDNLQSVFRKILHDDPPPLRDLGLDVPPVIQEVLDRSLAKRPRDRFSDTGDFLKELMQFWETLPAPAQARAAASTALGKAASKAAKQARRRWGWKRLIPLAAGAAIGIAGLLIVGGAFFGTIFFEPAGSASGAEGQSAELAVSEADLPSRTAGASEADTAVPPVTAATDTGGEAGVASPEATQNEESGDEQVTPPTAAPQREAEAAPARPAEPDPVVRSESAYRSARSNAVSERRRAGEMGAPELARDEYSEGESLLGQAERAAARDRFREAESLAVRAQSAFASATGAARALWRTRLDSARGVVTPLRAEADPTAAEYERAETLLRTASTAEEEGRYADALRSLSEAAESYRSAVAPVVEEPVETQPAPVPEPSTGEIVETTLEELRRAIEAEDLEALQRVWVGLRSDQLQTFERFFDATRDLEVSFEVASMDRSGDIIDVSVRTTYDFVSEATGRQHQPFTQQLQLARRDGRWVIVSSRS